VQPHQSINEGSALWLAFLLIQITIKYSKRLDKSLTLRLVLFLQPFFNPTDRDSLQPKLLLPLLNLEELRALLILYYKKVLANPIKFNSIILPDILIREINYILLTAQPKYSKEAKSILYHQHYLVNCLSNTATFYDKWPTLFEPSAPIQINMYQCGYYIYYINFFLSHLEYEIYIAYLKIVYPELVKIPATKIAAQHTLITRLEKIVLSPKCKEILLTEEQTSYVMNSIKFLIPKKVRKHQHKDLSKV